MSSLVVVIVFLFLNEIFDLPSFSFMRYLAAGVLLAIAYQIYTENERSGTTTHAANLRELAVFAFTLGFVHEEEFALLAICINNIDCILLMLTYAISVSTALVAVTLTAVASFGRIEKHLIKYKQYLPKLYASVLVVIALFYMIPLH